MEDSSVKKRIAIIGAGATGMTSVKACLEQDLHPVVFEKTDYTGGLWRFQEKLDVNGIASVMKTTIINSSKEMSAFSDFPPEDDCPNYMHNTKMVGYFDDYAKQFNFEKYVNFKREVLALEFANDYEETGRWKIRYKNLLTQEIKEETFDGVMVCTGHHGTVQMPTFPGQERFKGKVLHTHSLKTVKDFDDQNIVVVGIGNSGGDAAVEFSYVAKQVYLSSSRGTWVTPRVGPGGQPFDTVMHRRFINLLFNLLPYWLCCSFYERMLNQRFNHKSFHLKPKHRVLSQHIMVNDVLPNRIQAGTVKIKSDIDYFTENGVVFKGETQVTPCDAVIMATGYKVTFPFISEEIVPVHKNKVRLYKYQFVPHLKHPHTLAFISLAQPIGALLPIGELQARWFSLLMQNKLKLPTRDIMEKDIDDKLNFQKRFYESERHTIQVDWINFMDELSGVVGCKPPIWKYLFTDFQLFFVLMFGPCATYQYRLVGPNSWPGARQAMLQVMHRIKAPLQTNSIRNNMDKGKPILKLNWFHLVVIIGFISLFYKFISK